MIPDTRTRTRTSTETVRVGARTVLVLIRYGTWHDENHFKDYAFAAAFILVQVRRTCRTYPVGLPRATTPSRYS